MNLALSFAALTLLIVWLAAGPQQSPIYSNLAVFLFTGGKLFHRNI